MPVVREKLVLYLNYERVEITGDDAFLTLSTWLRTRKNLTGTKVVCSEGDCGACTVILGWLNAEEVLEYRIIDSCIQFLFQLDLCHVITVEALAEGGQLHPAQKSMVECFGSQCGFCTPGFVMALADLAEKEKSHTTTSIREKLSGNLCRCTGYEAIVKAGLALNGVAAPSLFDRFSRAVMEKDFAALNHQTVKIASVHSRLFFKPADLPEALKLKAAMPRLRIVAGATDLGVQHNKGKSALAQSLFVAHLHEISGVRKVNGTLEIGAAANWSDVLRVTKSELPALHDILKVFAAEQIRNAATIGGNIVNASPIADSLPCLYALNAKLVVTSASGSREIEIGDFYTGYKKIDLKPDEILTRVILPLPDKTAKFQLYKVSKRRDLDISTVTLALYLGQDVRIAAGGVAATIVRLKSAEQILSSGDFSEIAFRKAGEAAAAEINPLSDVRGSAEFRKILVRNLFLKFYHEQLHPHPLPLSRGGAKGRE